MSPDTFRKLAALGLTTEQIAGVLEIIEEHDEGYMRAAYEAKEKARERWRRWKANQPANADKRSQTLANVGKRLTRVEDSSSKNITTEDNNTTAPKARGGDLEAFKAELSPDLDAERIEAVIKHRRSKRGQLTAHAARLFRQDAAACGLSLAKAVDTCISRNWITVKPEYLRGRTHAPPATSPPKRKTVGEMWVEEARIKNDEQQSTGEIEGRLDEGDGGGQGERVGQLIRSSLPSGW